MQLSDRSFNLDIKFIFINSAAINSVEAALGDQTFLKLNSLNQRHPLGAVKKSKLCGTAPDYKGKMCGKVRLIFTCNYAAIFSKFVLELCGFPKRARLLTYFSFYIRKS